MGALKQAQDGSRVLAAEIDSSAAVNVPDCSASAGRGVHKAVMAYSEGKTQPRPSSIDPTDQIAEDTVTHTRTFTTILPGYDSNRMLQGARRR